jgi:hypothetical protein
MNTDEIYLLILSFIELDITILNNLSNTSKKWRRITKDYTAKKNCNICFFGFKLFFKNFRQSNTGMVTIKLGKTTTIYHILKGIQFIIFKKVQILYKKKIMTLN